MSVNIAMACQKSQLVCWCQFARASSHTTIYRRCSDFIKANFGAVTECSDFPTMDLDLLVTLVRSNDLVVADEVSSEIYKHWFKKNPILFISLSRCSYFDASTSG